MTGSETIVAENTEREAVVATPPKADLSKLASEPGLQIDFGQNTQKVEEQKPVVEEKKEETNPQGELTVENQESEKKEGEEVAAETVENQQPEEVVLSLEEEASETVAEEGSWIAYAKEKGLEITEDSVEAYEKAIIEPYEQKIADLDNKKMEDYFHDLSPQLRMRIELEKSGMTPEQIEAPFKNLEAFRKLSPVELYREDLTSKIEQIRELTDTDKAWIDAEIEKKVESGEIDHEAKRIHLELDSIEKQIIDEQQAIIEKYKVNNAKHLEESRGKEIESVTKALNEIPSFMGAVIAQESKQIMARKFSEGKYDQILNDPNKKAEFIMYHELGKKAYEAAIAKSEAKGKTSITKELSNVPPVENLGAGKSVTPPEQLTGLAKLKNEPGLK